jgi:peptidoglycan/xylan/chitin deacetylase (PgdA/CDA1 family)
MRFTDAMSGPRQLLFSSLARRTVSFSGFRPTVSFTFDDFPKTAYTNGGAILSAFQAAGTYYAAMGLVDSTSALGELFGEEDLRALVSDGHELANHTFSHLSCQRASTPTYLADVCKGQQALSALCGHTVAPNFSYPFGHVTLAAKRAMSLRTRSCRGIYGGINGPTLDLNLLKANRLYSWCFDLDLAKRLILENEKRAGWLIFYTHDVRSKPSAYGCKPEELEAVVRFSAQRRTRVMTVAQALAEL